MYVWGDTPNDGFWIEPTGDYLKALVASPEAGEDGVNRIRITGMFQWDGTYRRQTMWIEGDAVKALQTAVMRCA